MLGTLHKKITCPQGCRPRLGLPVASSRKVDRHSPGHRGARLAQVPPRRAHWHGCCWIFCCRARSQANLPPSQRFVAEALWWPVEADTQWSWFSWNGKNLEPKLVQVLLELWVYLDMHCFINGILWCKQNLCRGGCSTGFNGNLISQLPVYLCLVLPYFGLFKKLEYWCNK